MRQLLTVLFILLLGVQSAVYGQDKDLGNLDNELREILLDKQEEAAAYLRYPLVQKDRSALENEIASTWKQSIQSAAKDKGLSTTPTDMAIINSYIDKNITSLDKQ